MNSSSIDVPSSAFDRIRIETGEDSSGTSSSALVAESIGENAEIAFVPPENLWASNDAPLRLPLRSVRYAIAGDDSGHQAALVARYPREPLWVHAKGCSFEIADAKDAPAFEAVSTNGQLARIRCAPALKRIAAPLPGVVVEPGSVEEGMQLAFLSAPQILEKKAIEVRPEKIKSSKVKKKKKKAKPKLNIQNNRVLMRVQPQKSKKSKSSQSAPVKVYGKTVPSTSEPSPQAPVKVNRVSPAVRTENPGTVLQTQPSTRETIPETPIRVQQPPPPIQRGGVGVILQTQHGKKNRKVIPQAVIPSGPHPSYGFDFIRPDDLLALRFEFYNMTISAGGPSPSLVRVQPNQPAYMVIQFWPQHVAEEAFEEGNTPAPLGPEARTPVTSRVAGPSRLAFIIPDNVTEIPYTVES
ncbi:MAG: hypothetical protein ACREIC_20270, partial [Limisphaerales bacterium]